VVDAEFEEVKDDNKKNSWSIYNWFRFKSLCPKKTIMIFLV
jgi:hypothetical protein